MTPTPENEEKKTTKKISEFELPSNKKNKKTGINLLREKVPIFKWWFIIIVAYIIFQDIFLYILTYIPLAC